MSAAKTPNQLTNEQDLIARRFYNEVVTDEKIWASNTKTQRTVGGAVLQMLGYSVSAGVIVPIGTSLTFKYGTTPDTSEYVGIFDRDRMMVEGAMDEADNGTDTDETSPSESPESN